jgi:hypothetical protein
MDEPRTDETKVEQELEVEDLEVQSTEADTVRGGAGKKREDDGVEAQHNETLLEV